MLEQMVTSFIASAGFGIIFNAPKSSLFQCGLVGMIGWIIYFLLVEMQYDSVFASCVASIFVGVISYICAKMYKTPVIIFTVGGIIPLVPGGLAYDAMRHFVQNDYNIALQLAAKVFLISGAIAMGLVFAEVVNLIIRKFLSIKQKARWRDLYNKDTNIES